MPADTLEASSANDVFKSVESFNTPTPRPVTPPPADTGRDTSGPPADKADAGGQELIDKPDAMKDKAPEQKPNGEKKSALDKVGQVKKPEVAKPEQKPNGAAVEDKPVDTGNAKQLREAYEKQKGDMAALRAELDKVRPDAEKVGELRAELEGSREELARLKAMNLNDDERKEYGSLREQHALDVLRNSQDFKQTYLAPIHAQVAKIDSAAKQANLSPEATIALKDAMDNPDEFARDTEIEKILTAAELAPNIHSRLLNGMSAVGRELQEKLYPAMEAKEREAFNIQQAARVRDREQGEQKTAAEKAEFQKEHQYVQKLLSEESLKPLMEETDLSIDGVTLADAMKGAEAAENARDRAYQAHAGAALPFVIQYTNRLLQKVHDLEQANKIRNGSGPRLNDALVKDTTPGRETLTADQVFKSGQKFGN